MAEKSNINQNPNQAMLGLNKDSIPQQVKPGSLTYALNAQVNSFDGNMVTYQNEQSNVLCSEFKTGYKVIGYYAIGSQNRTIIFLANPHTGESEIGELSNTITCDFDDPTHLNEVNSCTYVNNGYTRTDCNCECEGSQEILTFYELYKKLNPSSNVKSCCDYRTIINAPCLNFNVNYPIHQVVHRTVDQNDDANKCGTEIYWADGLNPRRFINLDDLPYTTIVSGCERIKTGEISCDLMEVQAVVQPPCIYPFVVSDGGSLIAGTYQFAIQYTNDKGQGYTAYYSITNPIGIFRDTHIGFNFNYETDKSIKLRISNLDTRFKYFNLAVIKTINGVTEVELVGTYDIVGESQDFVYSGNDKTQINLTIDDIFQKYPSYKTAGGVNIVNDVIMWSNLKADKRVNYQSIANKIQLQWVTYQIPYNQFQSYSNGVNTALYRGYMRDEVYPFEISFILKDGSQTDSFHIPGRVSVAGDLTLVSNEDVITGELDNCVTEDPDQPRWKVYNTGTLIGNMPEFTAAPDPDCYVGPYQYGTMSYWESTKTYPCNDKVWGELAGQPIRHHKFPDNLITHIHNINPVTTDKAFEHKIYPIGIKLDLENVRQAILTSDLTSYEKSQIVGYRVVRGDRINNKSVIAKGVLYNMGVYIPYSEGAPATDQEVFYPNYPFNDLGDDPFLTNLSSAGDGGFSIFILDNLANRVESGQNQIESLQSVLTIVNAVCYSATGKNDCSIPNPAIIEITNSEIADLQNKMFTAMNAGQALLTRIEEILAYYQAKVDAGENVCQDDVVAMTLDATLVNNYVDAIDDIGTSSAMVNFQNIVNYITANAATLNSHPYADEIFQLRVDLVSVLNINTDLQAMKTPIQDNYTEWQDALVELGTVSCDDEVIVDSSFSRSRFTFHSPDTHFFQPFLGTYLKFETVEGGSAIGNFVQVKNHAGAKLMSAFSAGIALGAGIAVGALFAVEPKPHVIGAFPGVVYTAYYPDFPSLGTIAEKSLYWNQQFKQLIDNLLPSKNYAYQYNAVGYYNTFNAVPNAGNKQRMLDKAYYLIPGMQNLGDVSPINNWKRESSVFFRTDQGLTAPLFPNDNLVAGTLPDDDSRVGYSADKQIVSNVLSYYASNKRKMLDQYGDIYSYNTVDTGFCGTVDINQSYTNQNGYVFGGDIYINRFGLKRKLSYFIDTNVDKPDGTDISYSDLSNVGRVKYWYNTSTSQTPGSGFKGLMKSILGVPQSSLDGNTNKLFYQNGRIYLYNYGIAYFFAESEVNVDFRQAGNTTTHDFFPHVGTGIPNDWLQETNVPIAHDNYYIYNKTYSKQNKENVFSHLPLTFNPDEECQQDFTYRVIYSDPNRWRTYKPLSYFDFPRNHGKLTAINTINNSMVLVRFENKSYIYNALTAIQTSSGKYAYLGNDDVFKSAPPIDFGETDQGYAGSQHRLLLRTEAGHLFIDSKRCNIFLISGSTVKSISEQGMQKWFDKNLQFEIAKHFPDVNTDNHFNGVGITGVWDSEYQRFLITKLDYAPVSQYKSGMTYDSYYGKFYYNGQEILLDDPKYFCNKSWTLSYTPGIGAWTSFHSYIPNYYLGFPGFFITGNNGVLNNEKSSMWIHNVIHTSYQTFYGKLEPYVLEYPFVFKAQDEILQNVKDHTTILEYYNAQDFYEINDGIYFNKAVLWNNQQCSGVLNLIPKPKGNMSQYLNYPKYNSNSKDILFTKSDNFFNYNTFWDVVKNPNNHYPIWIESCINKSIDNELNNDKFDYSSRSFQKTKLRAKDLKVRHINDKFDRYKFISKFIIASSEISYK